MGPPLNHIPHPVSLLLHALDPSRAEVNKCSVMHWFHIDKAARELGFCPASIPFEETVDWFRARGYGASATDTAAGQRQWWRRRSGHLDLLHSVVAAAATAILCLAIIVVLFLALPS